MCNTNKATYDLRLSVLSLAFFKDNLAQDNFITFTFGWAEHAIAAVWGAGGQFAGVNYLSLGVPELEFRLSVPVPAGPSCLAKNNFKTVSLKVCQHLPDCIYVHHGMSGAPRGQKRAQDYPRTAVINNCGAIHLSSPTRTTF